MTKGAAVAVAAMSVAVILQASTASAAPTSVTIAGTFQNEVGCSGDWATTCAQSSLTMRPDGMWSLAITIPAGSYAYKAAINGSWSENYGAHAVAFGPDIPLTVPSGGRTVTFVYDPVTHWIADDINSKIAAAVGTFQTELGCSADWAPACLRSWLEDIDGDGVYTLVTTAIPAGNWQAKVAIGGSWSENYGQGGVSGGENIPFSVASAGATTTFTYNSSSHVLTISAGTGTTPTPTGNPGSPINLLGAIYSAASTTFRLWSPDNNNVSVTIGGTTYPMTPATVSGYSSVYQAVLTGNLKNQTYQFRVGSNDVRDPYAQMVNPGTTQGIVIDQASILPSTGSWAARPTLANREDAIGYELSVRDFTIDASSGVDAAKRGKFLGLVQTGTTYNGVKTGIDHLKDLGITTVQLMPTYDFASTVPNWGYDPLNFNVPEEQYSQFTAPEDRIREFKDMVNEYHRNGIRVVVDVVHNHTANKDVLQNITNKYYTAIDYSGCCGNSLDDSNPMVSRMIRDSLEHWVKNYNVDGFRFDLLGIFHHSQVESWGTYLNATYPDRNLLIYGEPWMGGVTPTNESDFVRYGTTASMTAGHIGVFNGAYRDTIKGGTRDTILGYMGGSGDAAAVALGMRGSPVSPKSTNVLSDMWNPAFTYDPEQTINYVSIHDDFNLWDKVTYGGVAGGATGRAGQMDKFAVGMVLTSQGIPVISEGDEFLRSKVVNGDYNTASNSYNAGDSVNAIHWADKVTNSGVYAYYKAAIALRRSTSALRLTTWDAINAQQSTQANGAVVVSQISSNPATPTTHDTVVVFNPATSNFNATLPSGTWTKVFDATGAVNATGTTCGPLAVTVFKRT